MSFDPQRSASARNGAAAQSTAVTRIAAAQGVLMAVEHEERGMNRA
jgi:hypothetical protein